MNQQVENFESSKEETNIAEKLEILHIENIDPLGIGVCRARAQMYSASHANRFWACDVKNAPPGTFAPSYATLTEIIRIVSTAASKSPENMGKLIDPQRLTAFAVQAGWGKHGRYRTPMGFGSEWRFDRKKLNKWLKKNLHRVLHSRKDSAKEVSKDFKCLDNGLKSVVF